VRRGSHDAHRRVGTFRLASLSIRPGGPGVLKFSRTHIGFGSSIRVGANGRYNRHIFPLDMFCRCTPAAQGLRKFSHAHVGFGWSIRVGANRRCNRHIFALALFCQFAPGRPGAAEILACRRWVRLVDSHRGQQALQSSHLRAGIVLSIRPKGPGVVESDRSVAAAGVLKLKSPRVRPLGGVGGTATNKTGDLRSRPGWGRFDCTHRWRETRAQQESRPTGR
jgi:hypothetical protein